MTAPLQLRLLPARAGLAPILRTLLAVLDDMSSGSTDLSIQDAVDLVIERSAVTLTSGSRIRFGELLRRFIRFASGHEVVLLREVSPELVTAFVQARTIAGGIPSVATTHVRLSCIRFLFGVTREYGLAAEDPTLAIDLARRPRLLTRPLEDDEVEACRCAVHATLIATQGPAVWALAEGGGGSSEIARVSGPDIDLASGSARFAGAARTDPRQVLLGDWGVTQLRRRLRDRPNDDLVVFERAPVGDMGRVRVGQMITDIMRRAGVGPAPDVRPRSVTAWAARRVFDATGQIDAAALHIGARSLDLVADLIGYDWRAVRGQAAP